MNQPRFNAPLHGFACLAALATLVLVGMGVLVTSHGAGMAVPDWPNTYGYNMFFFPVSQWVGGIFYEHTHRLMASTVGFLTLILALWLQGNRAQSFLHWAGLALLATGVALLAGSEHRQADGLVLGGVGLLAFSIRSRWPLCEPAPRWLRRLGLVAFGLVVLQGVLGGLRVVLFKDEIGIFHAALAQVFLALLCAIALFTSRLWQWSYAALPSPAPTLRQLLSSTHGTTIWVVLAVTTMTFLQLILGAAMRHQHAGLSIPDFPLAYGRWWPRTDEAAVLQYNQQRIEVLAANPITAGQIYLQMAHRITALGILMGTVLLYRRTWRQLGARHWLSRGALIWLGLVLSQAGLGAWTIWSNKAADVATVHVVVGALVLSLGTLLCLAWIRQAAAHYHPLRQAACSPATLSEFATPLAARKPIA